jgi:diguanylate cyclase (GGDEF)-like protein
MTNRQKGFIFDFMIPRFSCEKMEQEYKEWQQGFKSRQISAIAVLTGTMYVLYSLLDRAVAPVGLAPQMMAIHLYFIAPSLFLAGFLLFFKKTYPLGELLLFFAPIGAVVGNMIIISQLEDPAIYQTEIYLIIFWVFTVSGMRLVQATLCALIIVIIIVATTFTYFSITPEGFAMSAFWMFSTCTFGIFVSYFLEKSGRTIFSYNHQLEELAIKDKLTGVFNRRKLDEILQNELNRSQRFKQMFGLVVLDIDFFKNVNDKYGHLAGDEVLIAIAKLLKKNMRQTDSVVRWGGEEFILIYTGTDSDGVLSLAESLRSNIENHAFESVGKITASLGVTTYQPGDTMESIISRADKALYKAKDSGRNRVIII